MCVSAGSASVRACLSMSTSGAGASASIPDCILASIDPARHRRSTRRADFEAAWASLLPVIPVGALDEYRRDREVRAEIRAAHARGEKLPSEATSSLMRCVCGVTFDSHKPAESCDHRLHIYAAQREVAATCLRLPYHSQMPACRLANLH
jgi:hypothetical protein